MLQTERYTAEDRRNDDFIDAVSAILGRPLTADEEGIAFDCRDQGSYSAREAATEIICCAEA